MSRSGVYRSASVVLPSSPEGVVDVQYVAGFVQPFSVHVWVVTATDAEMDATIDGTVAQSQRRSIASTRDVGLRAPMSRLRRVAQNLVAGGRRKTARRSARSRRRRTHNVRAVIRADADARAPPRGPKLRARESHCRAGGWGRVLEGRILRCERAVVRRSAPSPSLSSSEPTWPLAN